jgi:hypothetical protein
MAITWSTTGRPFYVLGACSSGNLAGSVTPSGSNGLDMTGAVWLGAFGEVGNYVVSVAAHDGSTALGAGALRCWVKIAGTWSAYAPGDLTIAGGAATEVPTVIYPGPVDAVAYVPDSLGAQATDITILGASHFQILTLDAVGSSPNAYGMSLSDHGVLNLQPADATHPGAVTTGTQTIAGAKTFSGAGTFSSTLTVADALVAQSTLALTGALTASSNITAGGWLKLHSGTPYATAALGAGEISLNSGTSDAPGIHFYTAANTNFGIDASGSTLRFIHNLDEAGGTVMAQIDSGGVLQVATALRIGSGGPSVQSHAGSPDGAVSAAKGSVCVNTSGAGGTLLYVNTDGASAWTAFA